MTEQEIPIEQIFCDHSFNCRGHVTPQSVQHLSRDIAKDGLLSAIHLVNYDNNNGKLYKIIAGHRRYLAVKLLKWPTIRAIIHNNLDENGAKRINLVENLQRKDLDILQQSYGIKHYKDQGLSVDQIAKELSESRQWVDVRLKLLDLEEDIRTQAKAGLLTQQQILDLWKMPSPRRLEAAKIIKEARLSGEKIAIKKKAISPTRIGKKKDLEEVAFMLNHIISQTGESIGTRCLEWSLGKISDYDLFTSIKKECAKLNKEYKIPKEYEKYCEI